MGKRYYGEIWDPYQERCNDCEHFYCTCDKEKKKQKVEHIVKVEVKPPKERHGKVVCNSICGNLLLNNQTSNLEIWKQRARTDAIVNISVFNNTRSTGSIRVLVTRTGRSPVEFTVPPGNTNSASVDHVDSITVSQVGDGITEGKFCLDFCFVIFDEKDKGKEN
ncbi:S-Ena type endospore appendage [Bacillus sp. 1P10SD]|uniref:S-Ena type endospore appendage n=1 Tax=Bacillus sp. 1P10SD TaxID=3132265 RepID=UPI0039A5079A